MNLERWYQSLNIEKSAQVITKGKPAWDKTRKFLSEVPPPSQISEEAGKRMAAARIIKQRQEIAKVKSQAIQNAKRKRGICAERSSIE